MLTAIPQTSTRPTAPTAQPERYDAGTSRKLGAWRNLGRKVDAQDPAVVRDAAALMTSELFFAPMLAEMRKFPFGDEIGNGGRMEEAFGEQLDQRVADAVARSDGGFTEQLARRLERKPAATAEPPHPESNWWTELTARLIGEGEES